MMTLKKTVYNVDSKTVECVVEVSTSGALVMIDTLSESDLVANAIKNGRADWNTQDCKDLLNTQNPVV